MRRNETDNMGSMRSTRYSNGLENKFLGSFSLSALKKHILSCLPQCYSLYHFYTVLNFCQEASLPAHSCCTYTKCGNDTVRQALGCLPTSLLSSVPQPVGRGAHRVALMPPSGVWHVWRRNLLLGSSPQNTVEKIKTYMHRGPNKLGSQQVVS